MFDHSHIRHFSSVFVSLCDFELITQNSSENIASRQSRCIYVNGCNHGYNYRMPGHIGLVLGFGSESMLGF